MARNASRPGISPIVYPSGDTRTLAELARINDAETHNPDSEQNTTAE